MKLNKNIHGGRLRATLVNAFDHLISQKVRFFRTLSKLLEALQYTKQH